MAPSKPFQIRLTKVEHEALAREARRRSVSKSELVRSQLGAIIGNEPSVRDLAKGGREAIEAARGNDWRKVPRDNVAEKAPEPRIPSTQTTVHLGRWLSGRTGRPQALLEQRIRRGGVVVRGEVCRDLVVPAPLLPGEVVVDGEVL